MEYKVQNKFRIRESCGGSYVVIFFFEKMVDVTLETLLNDCPIEQYYVIKEKNEIAFRLKNPDDLERIGEFVEIKNPQ